MSVIISCSHCQKQLAVPEHALGQTVRCPVCQDTFLAAAPPSAAVPTGVAAVTAAPAQARPTPHRPEPTASPSPAVRADELPVRRRRPPARTGGRRALPWLIVSSIALGVAAVVGLVLVFVLNRTEDQLPANLWREVNNEHGRFHVLMPGVPQPGPGAQNFMTTGVEMDSNHNGFFVAYGDISGAELNRIPLEVRFDGARDGLVQPQKGGRVLRERPLAIDGHRAREVEAEVVERVPHEKPVMVGAVARFCAVQAPGKLRFYIVVAMGPGYRADMPEVRKFLDSFRPLPAAQAGGPQNGPLPGNPPADGPMQRPVQPAPPVPPPAPPPPAGPNPADYRHASTVVGLAFRKEGKWLFTGTEDQQVICWDVATKRPLHTVPRPPEMGEMGAFAVSPDGTRVAQTQHGGLLRLTDVQTGTTAVLSPPTPGGITRYCVGFSPDGKQLAVGQGDGKVTLWDVDTRRLLHTLTEHKNQVLSLAYAPDGQTLATAAADRTIRLWDPAIGQLKRTLLGHKPARVPWDGFRTWRWAIPALAFSPDGKLLASAGNDQNAIVWNLERRGLRQLLRHRECVLALAFAPDGKRLATGTADGEVTVFAYAGTWQERERLQAAGKAPVRALAFSPDGTRLAVAAGHDVEMKALAAP